ncbi:MAG: CPBP family intramembrane metalloprotease [Clostridium sp.]|nr:CPBP family intramembrane metalloprotease [Clostridium sp.]
MKNFWIMMNMRWSREDMSGWNSFRKTAYLLWPLLVYFIVHDVAQFLLWAVCGLLTAGSEDLSMFAAANALTLRGIINGLAILTGVVIIWKAVRLEIAGEEKAARKFVEAKEDGKSSEKKAAENSGREKADEGSGGKKETGEKKTDGIFVGRAEPFTRYFVLTVVAFLASLGLNLLLNLLGLTSAFKSYEETAKAQYGVNFIVGLFLYGLVSPFAEEAVFRGLIYNRMKRCFNYPLALFVSSLLFGCYHGNPVQALYGMVLGLLIAWCYEKCGSFAAPVLFHSAANLSMYVITYFGGFASISKSAGIGIAASSLLGAGGFLWYFKKYSEKA